MDVSWFTEVVQLAADRRSLATVVAALLLLAIAWVAGQVVKRRRVAAMMRAVDATTVGRITPRSRTDASGFAMAVVPPPEPFREFSVSYRCLSILDPVDVVRRFGRGQVSRFQLAANLPEPPSAELVWARGHPPGQVLGTAPGHGQWVFQQLDFAGADYATRGPNVAALRHVLRDMYSRYGPGLKQVVVQRERRPMVRLVMEGAIDLRDVSPLITSARALGRAALLE